VFLQRAVEQTALLEYGSLRPDTGQVPGRRIEG
jgi:hypothetical protein